MNERLQELAESHYQQPEFLRTLFELAVENNWFDLRHMVQHDMAKAIIADYSLECGMGYLDNELFFANWEQVVDVGWRTFCVHTGIAREQVTQKLHSLGESL